MDDIKQDKIRELKGILDFIISQHNSGNLPLIHSYSTKPDGTYYNLVIKDGKFEVVVNA